MKRLIVHRDARAELDEAMAWYEERQPGLGLALHAEVEALFERIQSNSLIGTPYKSTEYRFLQTQRFPYIVYYLELEYAVWVAAIAHGRRRPDSWRRREPTE